MAWTTPTTYVTGQVWLASSMNLTRDNLGALSTHAHTGAAGDGATLGVFFSVGP